MDTGGTACAGLVTMGKCMLPAEEVNVRYLTRILEEVSCDIAEVFSVYF